MRQKKRFDGFNSQVSRRDFIHLAGTGMASIYLGGCASFFRGEKRSLASENPHLDSFLSDQGPFNRKLGDLAPRVFSGDDPHFPHPVLRHKAEYLEKIGGTLPKPSEFVELTIVGGGISGLSSAYLLRDKKPLILEQARRFGGNSKGESWKGIDYTIGAAYLNIPEEGGVISTFFKEIGLDKKLTRKTQEDPIFIDGKPFFNIWETGTGPENQRQFQKIAAYVQDVAQGKNGQFFPDIPVRAEDRERVNELDRISFRTLIERVLSEPIHPHLDQVIAHYFWSTNSASSDEMSAAAGLNFFASDFEGSVIAPGGNGAIAESVLRILYEELGPNHLRSSSLVFDVKVVKDGVHISYVDRDGKITTVFSKYVIMSCPKFVVPSLIDGLEPERIEAIQSIKYRAYLVGNLIVNAPLKTLFYDAFPVQTEDFLGHSDPNVANIRRAGKCHQISDITYCDFGQPKDWGSVLTLYRALPYEGARREISGNSYERLRKEFEAQIERILGPSLGVAKQDVVDLRVTRWGHPLPLSEIGNIASGKVDWLRKPFQNRVYFVEQDNWTLPAFENAFEEAHYWTTELRKRI